MNKLITILLASLLWASCSTSLTDEQKADLKKQLDDMVKTDQIAASRWEEKWAVYKDSVFSTHKLIVEKMFKDYGFLGFDKIGEDGSYNFWLIVQHCDKFPEFQKEILSAMDKEVKNKNANANNFAYLYDRVQVNAGQKQKFGTQLDYAVETTGRAFPKFGLMDSTNVDKNRQAYDLEPLKDYLNQMTSMHYDMNKERYEKMGIAKPNLY